jgi:hypothetical protein
MLLLFRALWFVGLLNSAQEIDYAAAFHKPVNIELVLAGNFGELRPNHFHTGIDIKTQGKEGIKLYAIADGYVSRIKTGTSGYGKVIYIDHPQYGITSVYAHCQNFLGTIAEYTLLAQQKNEFYEIDIPVPYMALPIKKGDVIALSGNTGSSSAPHLHFEIRETKTEHPLNPLLFSAFQVADSRAPHIQNLVVYGLSRHGYRIPGKKMEIPVKKYNDKYRIARDTLEIPAHFCSEYGGIGLALGVHDKYDAAENICGIYQGILVMNGDTVHKQLMSRLDFEYIRQINTHKDYESYKKNKTKIEKYFRTVHNKIPIYEEKYGKGILGLQPGHNYKIEFSVSDISKNKSFLSFVIRTLSGQLRQEDTPYDVYNMNYLYPDSNYLFKGSNYQVELAKDCIFEPVQKRIEFKDGKLSFCDAAEPVNKTITYKLKLTRGAGIPKEKTVMYHLESKTYATGSFENEWFVTQFKQMGTFTLDWDTIAPKLNRKFKVLPSPQSISRLSWSVKDDKSGLAYYALYVDGSYHLLEYEHKNNELFANIKLNPGKHDFRIVVKDAIGNQHDEVFELIIK